MLDQIITHLDWMVTALKQQHDAMQIGGGDSKELGDAIALLAELQLRGSDGVIISNRTRRDIIRVAKLLSFSTPDKAEYGKALLKDLQEEGVSIEQ